MWTVGHALRPAQLTSATYTSQEPAAAAAASRQMGIILLASFAAIVVLAILAVVVGRRALRQGASAQSLARLRSLALWVLVGGLAIGLLPLLLYSVGIQFNLFPELPGDLLALPVSLVMAGALGSLTVFGLVARQTPVGADRPETLHVGARICLIIAPLLDLAGFAFISVLADFFAAFYLHLVY